MASSTLDSVPPWLLNACRPIVPALESIEVGLDERALVARLVQSATSFTSAQTQPDFLSAAFYATLALALDPFHVIARRTLASATLAGADASDFFPFHPSATAGAAASSAVTASAFVPPPSRPPGALTAPTPLAAEGSDCAAQAALHVLEQGGPATFRDPDSAAIYADACRRLGRFREGEEALAWTMRVQSSPSTSTVDPALTPPPFSATQRSSPADAQRLCQAASLALAGNRQTDAVFAYRSALEHHDRWRWSAWTGYCDAGGFLSQNLSLPNDEVEEAQRRSAISVFGAIAAAGHRASDFLAADLESRHAELVSLEDELAQMEQQNDNATGPITGLKPPASGTRTKTRTGPAPNAMTRATSANSATNPSRPALRASGVAASTRSATAPTFHRPGSRPTTGPNATATSKRTRSGAVAPSTTMQTTTRMNAARANGPQANDNVRGGRSGSANTGTKDVDNESETSTVRRSTRIHGATSRPGTSSGRLTTRPGAPTTTGPSLATRSRTAAPTPSTNAPGTTRTSLRSRPASTNSVPQIQAPAPAPASARTARPTSATTARRVSSRSRQVSSNTTGTATASNVGPVDEDADSRAAVAQARYEALLQLKEEMCSALRYAVLEAERWTRVDRAIADLLCTLGEAYQSVRTYHSRRAVWLLRSANIDTGISLDHVLETGELPADLVGYKVLDRRIVSTAPVQGLLGRAYHDLAKYAEAESHFALARKVNPTVLSGMDIYALTLFHLNREVALAALAQECLLLDKASAVANLVAGNTFSLQREHAVALRFFRRAMTVAPGYAYAYTLAGYEALELGQRDDAKAFFRAAIRCDRRHWNAWSGLGQINLLEGHWSYAEFHYSQAVDLNSQNAVLWDLCGWVREMGGDKHTAIRFYDHALALDPAMAMTMLKRGELMVDLGYDREAHENFVQASKLAPHEARVHILLAKSYMRLAGGHFAELEPPGADEDPDGANEAHLDAAGFVRRYTAAGGAGRAKAMGEPTYVTNSGYERAIAHHLAVAIDLDPRSVRAIKAMGEGVHAAMQSAAKRGGVFDPTGMTSLSMSLNEAPAAHASEGSTSRVVEDASRLGSSARLHVHPDLLEQEQEGPTESSGYGVSHRHHEDDWSEGSDPDQSMLEEDVDMV